MMIAKSEENRDVVESGVPSGSRMNSRITDAENATATRQKIPTAPYPPMAASLIKAPPPDRNQLLNVQHNVEPVVHSCG